MRTKQGKITANKNQLIAYSDTILTGKVSLERIETTEEFKQLERPARLFLKAVRVFTVLSLRRTKPRNTKMEKLNAFRTNLLNELEKY